MNMHDVRWVVITVEYSGDENYTVNDVYTDQLHAEERAQSLALKGKTAFVCRVAKLIKPSYEVESYS